MLDSDYDEVCVAICLQSSVLLAYSFVIIESTEILCRPKCSSSIAHHFMPLICLLVMCLFTYGSMILLKPVFFLEKNVLTKEVPMEEPVHQVLVYVVHVCIL